MQEKKRVNKTFIYVTSMILLVLLIAGSIGLATWAVLKTKVDIGGDIGFTGTGDVLATVSDGKVNGVKPDGKMKDITIGADYVENATDLATWAGLKLEFEANTDGDAQPVVLEYTITNNHTEKALLVTTEITTGTLTNVTWSMKYTVEGEDAVDVTDATDKTPVEVAAGKSVTYTITYTPAKNSEASVAGFNYRVNLVNKAA